MTTHQVKLSPQSKRRPQRFLAGGQATLQAARDFLIASRIAWKFLVRFFWTDPSEPLELLYGVLALFWGVWVAIPSINTFAVSPAYDGMHYLFGQGALLPYAETIWGVWLTMTGLGQLMALLFGTYKTRILFGMIALGTWSFITSMYIRWDWRATTTPVYAVLLMGLFLMMVWLQRKGRSEGCGK